MQANAAIYDQIGATYAARRRPDPRIFSAIDEALGDATTVLDVGAGTGSYELGGRRFVAVEPVVVPHDWIDGFFAAYWRRPEQYVDPTVRAAISGLALLDPPVVGRMVAALEADLASGRWHERHHDLLELNRYDHGYRLVITDP
ncbi:MAG: hypothetical protein ACT452_14650 [Microthrixaceae bacterium]